jgi:dCMP deaminase
VRPGWDLYFLSIAGAVAARGDCRRRQVGAVLVRPDRTIASTGFNGTAPGGLSCLDGECPRAFTDVEPGSSYDSGPGVCVATHAEANCLLFSREDTKGFVMYLTTAPCGGCERLLRSARLSRVVWPDGGWVL